MTSGSRPPAAEDSPPRAGRHAVLADSRFADDDTCFALSAFADSPDPAAHEDASTSSTVIALVGWPQLRRLPAAQQVDIARICALLAHSPSASFLIHRRLDLPVATVRASLRELRNQGCLRAAGRAVAAASPTPGTEEPVRADSLWSKLLRRLRS